MTVKISGNAFYYFGVSTHFLVAVKELSETRRSGRHPLMRVIDCLRLIGSVDGCNYSSPGFFSRRDDLSCRQQEAEAPGVPQLQGEGVLNAQRVVGPVRARSRGFVCYGEYLMITGIFVVCVFSHDWSVPRPVVMLLVWRQILIIFQALGEYLKSCRSKMEAWDITIEVIYPENILKSLSSKWKDEISLKISISLTSPHQGFICSVLCSVIF